MPLSVTGTLSKSVASANALSPVSMDSFVAESAIVPPPSEEEAPGSDPQAERTKTKRKPSKRDREDSNFMGFSFLQYTRE